MQTQEEWYQLIRQWEQSTLTREAFCLAYDLSFDERGKADIPRLYRLIAKMPMR